MITCSFSLTEAVHTDGGEEREEENTHRTHTAQQLKAENTVVYRMCGGGVEPLNTRSTNQTEAIFKHYHTFRLRYMFYFNIQLIYAFYFTMLFNIKLIFNSACMLQLKTIMLNKSVVHIST